MTDLKTRNTGDYISQVKSNNCHDFAGFVGEWNLYGDVNVRIPLRNKPTPEQIKNTEEAFGWEWKDYE